MRLESVRRCEWSSSLPLYAKTKNILLYFGEVSKTTISKSIVWKRSVADA